MLCNIMPMKQYNLGDNRKKTVSLRTLLIYPYVALVICLAIAIGLLSYQAGSRAVETVSKHLLFGGCPEDGVS